MWFCPWSAAARKGDIAVHRIGFLLLFLVLATLIVRSACADPYAVTFERNVAMKTRDGVTLYADIFRPKADGRFPVLLQRTPYDKNSGVSFGLQGAVRGYIVIIQDVRGRYTSEGEWYVFKHESEDGYDAVEWAAALPYSNGKVGMWGGSYVGATQMLAAIAHPPHLAGICPIVTASNYHENWTYQGGALEQWFDESWTSGLAQNTFDRQLAGATNAVLGDGQLPLTRYPLFNMADSRTADLSASLAPYFLDWLAHPTYDEYWRRWSIEEHYADITVPALTMAAWYDIFQDGSLRNYVGLKTHAGSESARRGQHLLVALGGHAGAGPTVGDVDFGAAAKFNGDEATLDWYDFLFKGAQNEFAQKHVTIFVMGVNQWRQEDDWPLARAKNTRYYLHSQGAANSAGGNGSLSTKAPNSEPPDRYVYDPANPVPTIGGALCCDSTHLKPGARDQRPAEARQDVLVYSTGAFSEDVEVTGPVGVELYAQSSAVDTDFTAKLVDVGPDGFARNLSDGIIRARYRASREKAELLTPGQVYKVTVDLWSTSNVFLKGHALRLEISSSNFPRFDRNLNTAEQPESGQHFVPATNVIYHDRGHPSVLILPVAAGQ
jgi:putative CocE/NonD family hydrolase